MNQGAGSWSANYPASAYRGAYPPNYYGAGNYANNYAPSYSYSPSQYGQLPNGPQTFANGSSAGALNRNANGGALQGRVQYGWW